MAQARSVSESVSTPLLPWQQMLKFATTTTATTIPKGMYLSTTVSTFSSSVLSVVGFVSALHRRCVVALLRRCCVVASLRRRVVASLLLSFNCSLLSFVVVVGIVVVGIVVVGIVVVVRRCRPFVVAALS